MKSVCIRSYSGPNSAQMRENTDQNNSEFGQNSCLTDKTLKDYKMTLIEIEKVVSDERELMNIFNTFQILFQK